MAERKVYDCDSCDKQNLSIKTIHLTVDRGMDGAGSAEDRDESIDLCLDCLCKAINLLTKNFTHTQAKEFLRKMAGKKWHPFWGSMND